MLRNSFHDKEALLMNLFRPSLLLPSFWISPTPPFLSFSSPFSLTSMHTHTHTHVHTRRLSRTRVHARTHTHGHRLSFAWVPGK